MSKKKKNKTKKSEIKTKKKEIKSDKKEKKIESKKKKKEVKETKKETKKISKKKTIKNKKSKKSKAKKRVITCISKKGFIFTLNHKKDCVPAGHCYCEIKSNKDKLTRIPKTIHIIAGQPFTIPKATYDNNRFLNQLKFEGKIKIHK